jgi:hypothetical protein
MRRLEKLNDIEQLVLNETNKNNFLCFSQALLYLRLGNKITRFQLRFPHVFYLKVPPYADIQIVCENLHTGEKNENYKFDMFEMMQEDFIIYTGEYKY